MRAQLARRIARRYGVEVVVRATSPVRAMVIPGAPGSDVRGRPVAVLRRGDTLATFRASVRGACVMLRKHTAETLPGDMEVTTARAILDALPLGPR